ncbi:hypothetical protein TNCV_829551 [Trichonephila clavipes]|nr:hypothetical protein TNCV_829551 [Trichonephila clavipes]
MHKVPDGLLRLPNNNFLIQQAKIIMARVSLSGFKTNLCPTFRTEKRTQTLEDTPLTSDEKLKKEIQSKIKVQFVVQIVFRNFEGIPGNSRGGEIGNSTRNVIDITYAQFENHNFVKLNNH